MEGYNFFTIYETCYEILILIAYELDDKYSEDESESLYEELWQILMDSDKLVKKIEEVSVDIPENIVECQRIMQLIVASKAYLASLYSFKRQIYEEDSVEMLSTLDEMDYDAVINEFEDKSPVCLAMIEGFFDYLDLLYIGQDISKSMAFSEEKVDNILKLNPFEILDLGDYVSSSNFMTSELFIQTVYDIYQKAKEYTEINKDSMEEDPDEYFIATFLKFLKSIYANDEEVILAVRYILANVYEEFTIDRKNFEDKGKEVSYLQYIEKVGALEAVNRFLNDPAFATFVLNSFINANFYLCGISDIFDRRESFKQTGREATLQKINPWFKEEEIVLNRIKETSE